MWIFGPSLRCFKIGEWDATGDETITKASKAGKGLLLVVVFSEAVAGIGSGF